MFPSKTAVISGGAGGVTFSNNFSIKCDGATNYLSINNTFQDIIRTDAFSIGFWAKPGDGQPPGGTNLHFFGTREIDNTTGSRIGMFINGTTGKFDGKIAVTLDSEDTGTQYWVDGGTTFADGEPSDFAHFLVTITEGKIVVYKDGSLLTPLGPPLDGDISSLDLTQWTCSENMALMARNEDGTIEEFMAGYMDEFAVYGEALSSDDALEIYNSGTPSDLTSLSAPKPIVWWRFEEGTGTTANDYDGNSSYVGTMHPSGMWSPHVPG